MTQTTTLPERLRARLHELGVGPDDRLVVAVSAGADSTALLHLLRFAVDGSPHRLVVGHFDHRMRPDSGDDARWVRGVARAWGLRVEVGTASEVPRGEAEARTVRWRFLESLRASIGAEGVVTAHHRDDQVETVLHHLARGSGLRGLSGIRPRTGTRLRPLLDEPRSELRRWAREAGLRWRTDPSNALPIGPRNRLRNELIPLLEEIRPGAARSIARSAEIAAAEEAALTEAESLLLEPRIRLRRPGRVSIDLAGLRSLPHALLSRLLRRLAREVGGALDEAGTRAALAFTLGGPGGGEARIPPGITLRRSLGVLEVEGPRPADGLAERSLRVARPLEEGEGLAVVGGESWAVRWGPTSCAGDWVTSLPYDSAAPGFHLRGWRDGDQLDGVSVGRLWSRAGVPLHERRRRPVVENGDGRLVWVPGTARSAHLDEHDGPRYRIGVSHVDPS